MNHCASVFSYSRLVSLRHKGFPENQAPYYLPFFKSIGFSSLKMCYKDFFSPLVMLILA